jgi:hypothetical protein
MESDFQSIIIERLGKLDKTVKSLKASNKKLSEKFDDIEIQGFHDQIQALNKRIDSIEGNILSLERVVAVIRIEATQLHMLQAIGKADSPNRIENREHIISEHSKMKQQIIASSDPLSLMFQFDKDCTDYSKKQNLKAYRE